jgi:signal transduction histidine kinase
LSRAAEVIRAGTHQALGELREVIGVLRSGESADPTAGGQPLPGLADLDRLIEESRAAGTPVDVDDGGLDTSAVPDPVGRTVYRVVQEGLTNARKHAPGSPVRVTLGGGPGGGLDVSVANRVPAAGSPMASVPAAASVPGTGTGLIGLAERLDLAGGTLEHRRDAGEFMLHAWLPWAE